MAIDRYSNPLTERYASAEMSYIFSPKFKFTTWRRLWLALAEAEQELGLPIPDEAIAAIRAHLDDFDLKRAGELERQLRHDVMAHVHHLGEQAPAAPVPEPAGDTTVQLLRTIPEHVYDRIAGGAFGILEGYMRALRSARELVYLESQFFWLPEIVDLLAGKVREPPDDRFRVVVVLPSKPNNGEEDTRGMLAHLADADDGRGRFLATTIDAMTGSTVDPLYVHAKIGIVDDRWLTIGSANLNAHSFFNDSEVNVQICDQTLARSTRLRLWSEHLGLSENEIAGDPTEIIDGLWIPIARREGERRRTGQIREHRVRELTPSSRKLERLLGPMDAIVVDS